MAGTRYILGSYLTAIGLDKGEVDQCIAYLVARPGYPSLAAIKSGFADLHLNFQKTPLVRPDLGQLKEIAIATIDQGTVYILILQTCRNRIMYLAPNGEFRMEPYQRFLDRWTGDLFHIAIPDRKALNHRLGQLQKTTPEPNYAPSLKEIKNVRLTNEPVVYILSRHVSPFFTYIFVRLHINPNWITLSWLFPIILAAYVLSTGFGLTQRLLAVSMIFAGYILDCSDGEVARITARYSRIGGYLDSLIHWISGPLLIFGITLGIFSSTHNTGSLKQGLTCMASGAFYNYIAVQLSSWKGHQSPYGEVDMIFGPLHWLIPLDLNLFVLGALINELSASLTAWTFASLILSCSMIGVFFRQEYNRKKSRGR